MDPNTSQLSVGKTLEQLNDERVVPKIPTIALVVLLMSLGVVGNAVTCYVFGFRLKQCTTNFFILVLAIFDMLSCCITMPTDIVDLRYPLMFPSDIACRVLRFLTYFTSGSSTLILLAVAVDRYQRVCHPLRPQLSLRRAKALSLLLTVVAVMITCPVLYLTGSMTTPAGVSNITGTDCALADSVKSTLFPSIYLSVLFVFIIILFVVIFTCYLLLWIQVRRIFSKSHTSYNVTEMNRADSVDIHNSNKEEVRGRSKTNLMVFLVTLLFTLSYFPCLILMIERAAVKYQTAMTLTTEIFHSLGMNSYDLSCSLNPAIYYLCHKKFKDEVKKIFSSIYKKI